MAITHSTFVASGRSAAAGALSSPMLEQLTTQDGWGPASAQLQLTGHGLQLLPPLASPCGPEPHASRQHSATSKPDKKLNPGTRTPCFRLDRVCPFPPGIAHSHRIASDVVSPLSVGRSGSAGQIQTCLPLIREDAKNGGGDALLDAVMSSLRLLDSSGRISFL